jgi:hypothetical protein
MRQLYELNTYNMTWIDGKTAKGVENPKHYVIILQICLPYTYRLLTTPVLEIITASITANF